ncbi:GtrA family protein [Vibrio renipiscarius]|uniref:Polysaccharide biosynthesis protein GtrA n=1 Tax=Vibrio renipiscarius TaxID=1461322 RepID=A0A0C2JC98_9VIBR|nr:GtrA family protein [Vibrio renipiscarius]KII75534.1 polysaccharide biosynthesis protein GtrA [Vibrio renipiscarius]KII82016.1 polysaccharide biosynthesis protein GtrA [Vibrio renipiscarius]
MAFFHHRMVKFALVGGIGFIVDASLFTLCVYGFSMPLLVARSVAFFCAASATWLGNRCFTFQILASQGEAAGHLKQWMKFLGCALISAMPNFAVFQTVLFIFGDQGAFPFLALVSGIGAGMVSNYLLSSRFVFTSSRA